MVRLSCWWRSESAFPSNFIEFAIRFAVNRMNAGTYDVRVGILQFNGTFNSLSLTSNGCAPADRAGRRKDAIQDCSQGLPWRSSDENQVTSTSRGLATKPLL
jgi:hypothetical protein